MNQFLVTTDGLNLRKGPSTDTTVISELTANTVVEKVESSTDNKWFRVNISNNGSSLDGWVAARFLEAIDDSAGAPSRLNGDGWIDQIGDFKVERKEIPRPGNKPYFNNSHTMIGVLHTTESNTVKSAFDTLAKNHSAPHFIAGEGRILQCRPVTKQGAALKSAGGVNPNTDAALQIEMVARSELKLWTPVESSLQPVLAIMRWASGDPLNIPLQRPSDAWRDDCTDVPLPWAVPTNRRRLANVWPKAKGWYMHMEVPVNDHFDCGALRFREMLARAAQG